MASFYEVQLFVLGAFCVGCVLVDRYSPKSSEAGEPTEDGSAGWKLHKGTPAGALAHQYLWVYAIVMGADWLQGPYVYSLYHEEYLFPERIVATLFVTGFLSAGLTAPLVGAWADQHGRRAVCKAFCIIYTLACACTLSSWLPILFFGRILGGISTSILYSAFESWLVSSANNQGVRQAELSSIFGRATLVNGFVATSAGVISNKLVATFGTFTSPFISSGILLLLGYFVIGKTWSENYGGGGGVKAISDPFQIGRLGQAWRIVRNDSALLALGLTQTCFEGSMYLFVFAWVPSLQERSGPFESLPLGYIFSAFMVSMMLGSVLYTWITATASVPKLSNAKTGDNALTLHAKLSSLVCTVSAFALAASVVASDARYRFWAFCLFEACVGMYYPVQGMLRGALISNDHRATLSSLFRVPLNVFVVVSLMTGVSSARLYVFAFCALVLSISAIVTGLVVVKRTEETPSDHSLRP